MSARLEAVLQGGTSPSELPGPGPVELGHIGQPGAFAAPPRPPCWIVSHPVTAGLHAGTAVGRWGLQDVLRTRTAAGTGQLFSHRRIEAEGPLEAEDEDEVPSDEQATATSAMAASEARAVTRRLLPMVIQVASGSEHLWLAAQPLRRGERERATFDGEQLPGGVLQPNPSPRSGHGNSRAPVPSSDDLIDHLREREHGPARVLRTVSHSRPGSPGTRKQPEE